VLAASPLAATQIWLWGQGFQPQMPSFADLYGRRAGLTSAVDLVRGLGVLADIAVHDVPGASAGYENDYAGQRDAALAALAGGCDLFIVHVEASDEAGHAGNASEKVRSLERWDAEILTDLVAGLDELGPWRMLLLPDHATPLRLKTHTSDPVPYSSTARSTARAYTGARRLRRWSWPRADGPTAGLIPGLSGGLAGCRFWRVSSWPAPSMAGSGVTFRSRHNAT
jgi:2,3-diphosphopglycerate-independent phosphoglycerate mutase